LPSQSTAAGHVMTGQAHADMHGKQVRVQVFMHTVAFVSNRALEAYSMLLRAKASCSTTEPIFALPFICQQILHRSERKPQSTQFSV
jgi:hypothetical protein